MLRPRLCQVIKVGICIGILLTYPLQAYIPIEIIWPGLERRYGPFKRPLLTEIAFRTAFVLFTCEFSRKLADPTFKYILQNYSDELNIRGREAMRSNHNMQCLHPILKIPCTHPNF